jgi:hypothetical protein
MSIHRGLGCTGGDVRPKPKFPYCGHASRGRYVRSSQGRRYPHYDSVAPADHGRPSSPGRISRHCANSHPRKQDRNPATRRPNLGTELFHVEQSYADQGAKPVHTSRRDRRPRRTPARQRNCSTWNNVIPGLPAGPAARGAPTSWGVYPFGYRLTDARPSQPTRREVIVPRGTMRLVLRKMP